MSAHTLYASWIPQTANLSALALSGNPTGYAFLAGAGAITVNGTVVASGSVSDSIALSAGTAATIMVVATETGKTAKTYTLSVTRLLLAVGDSYGGGKIAYILQNGDNLYSATVQHGLIASTADQGNTVWALPGYKDWAVPNGTIAAYGAGSANTDAIIAQQGAGTGYAAGLARAYRGGGYSDWFLPSKDELNQLYLNKAAIGGFGSNCWYWPSSENPSFGVWVQGFDDGSLDFYGKNYLFYVRAVRAF